MEETENTNDWNYKQWNEAALVNSLNSVLDFWESIYTYILREKIAMSYLGVVWYAIYKENNHGI